jgi:hypothetical protein
MRYQAEYSLRTWQSNFPVQARIEKTVSDFNKRASIVRGAGVFQILTGVAGLIVTIVDANMEDKITTEVPDPKNSRIPNKVTTTLKHEWGMTHTITTILSGGFILSGIITVNF